jgi:hypothetical protein
VGGGVKRIALKALDAGTGKAGAGRPRVRFVVRDLIDHANTRYVRPLREKAGVAAIGTQLLMSLRIGDDELSLGRDITPAGDTHFPPHLQRFDNQSAYFRARLERVLALDRTPDTLEGSAATDWTRLSDRMNFIIDLFRSRQQTPAIFGCSLHVDRPPQPVCTCALEHGRLAA